MSSVTDSVPVPSPEKPVPLPIDTSSLPTPDPSATSTSAKKQKKKKKKKKKASSDGTASPTSSTAPGTPTSPATSILDTLEEDDDASAPLTPDGEKSHNNLPPTPLSGSGILPLTEEPPASPPVEEDPIVPAIEESNLEAEPDKMGAAPPMEETEKEDYADKLTTEPITVVEEKVLKAEETPAVVEDEKAEIATDTHEPIKSEESHADTAVTDISVLAAEESTTETVLQVNDEESTEPEITQEPIKVEPPIEDVAAVAEPVAETEAVAEVAKTENESEPESTIQPLVLTDSPESQQPEPEKDDAREHPPTADPAVEDIAAVVEETKADEVAGEVAEAIPEAAKEETPAPTEPEKVEVEETSTTMEPELALVETTESKLEPEVVDDAPVVEDVQAAPVETKEEDISPTKDEPETPVPVIDDNEVAAVVEETVKLTEEEERSKAEEVEPSVEEVKEANAGETSAAEAVHESPKTEEEEPIPEQTAGPVEEPEAEESTSDAAAEPTIIAEEIPEVVEQGAENLAPDAIVEPTPAAEEEAPKVEETPEVKEDEAPTVVEEIASSEVDNAKAAEETPAPKAEGESPIVQETPKAEDDTPKAEEAVVPTESEQTTLEPTDAAAEVPESVKEEKKIEAAQDSEVISKSVVVEESLPTKEVEVEDRPKEDDKPEAVVEEETTPAPEETSQDPEAPAPATKELKEATSEIAPAEKLETPTSKDEQEAIPSEESPAPAETSEHAEEEATQVAVEEEEMPVTPVEEPLAPTEETTVPVEETAASAEQSPEPAEEKAEDTPAAIETPAAAEEEKDSVTFEETPGSVETSEPVEETPIPVEEAAASVEDQIPAHVEEKPENTPEAEVVETSTPAETPAPIEAEPEASEEKVEEPVLAEPVKEEDDIVLVNHDEAKPEDVVAAEAAAIPELEEAVPEKVEDALVSAEEKETEKVADLSTEDEQPLEESEAQKAESSDAVAIESAQDLSEEVNVDPIPVVDAESIHDHVKLDQEAYESTEPTVPLELLEEERESDTPIEQVADTAAEVADVAQELDQAIPTEEAKALEAPEPTEDLSQEVKIVPLPASEYAENPIYLEPGEPVPVDLRTASIDKNVRLDKESYEGAELTIPAIPTEPAEDMEVSSKLPAEGLSEAVGVSPLPASEGSENPIHLEPGEPIPKDINTASIDEHVKLDKESYESTEPNVPITSKEPTEEALLGEDLSEEAGISPLPASENAENPIHLEPGESIPEDIRAASIDKDVKLDKESYESTEPTVPIAPKELAERTPPETVKRDIDEEFEVSPLPAYENAENPIQLQPGEPIPDNVTTASIHDNVTLDQESYESATPIVPLKVVELERKSDTPIQEVAETAAEVADVAQKLDEPEEVATKDATESIQEVAERPVTVGEVEPVAAEKTPDAPVEDKSVKDVLSSSDKTDFIVPAAVLAAGAAGAAVVVVGHVTHSETPVTAKSEGAALIDETGTHSTLDRTKVTEFVDESTAHRKSDEEMITEPAPQTTPSPIHGEIVAEAEVPKLVEFNVSEEAPTVIVSSPTEEPIGQPGRTVEIVKPTPPENSPEGIRKRRAPGDLSPQHRPTSSGSDIVSARTHRNIMHTFWQVFFFGWLGGVGRFFGGMFNRKKRGGAATGSS